MEEVSRVINASDKKVPEETSLPWIFTDKPVTVFKIDGMCCIVYDLVCLSDFD